eukprot:13012699-Alexandrium_andersonii.AAC.1
MFIYNTYVFYAAPTGRGIHGLAAARAPGGADGRRGEEASPSQPWSRHTWTCTQGPQPSDGGASGC